METEKLKGSWIQAPSLDYGDEDELYYQHHPHTLLKSSFEITTLKKSVLKIASLGYYIAYINGKRVGRDELNSDWTNFEKCVYYDTYDVTAYLKIGKNEIVIELGNGMYNPSPLRLFGKYNLREKLFEVGQPKAICSLWCQDDLILESDETWVYSEGNILFNNLYLGEIVDFRRTEQEWKKVVVDTKERNLIPSFIPKIKKTQCINPKVIKPFENGIFVDFDEMVSGFINMVVDAKEGQEITLRFSEDFKEGKFDFNSSYAGHVGCQMKDTTVPGGKGSPKCAIQLDKFICKEGHNHFENKFCYHSFRYVYIEGCAIEDIKNIEAIYVHTDLKQIGQVRTDHSDLNSFYDAAMRTKLNNVHSTFEDCARERLGYGGDMVALATSNLYTFDLEALYKKIILDFRYDQTENGGMPETAPYMGIQSNGTAIGEGPILWQLVYPYLMFKRYQYYGDQDLIEQEYPYLKKHMDYLMNYDLEELVTRCLGDHGSILIAGQFRKPTPDKLLLGYCTVLLMLKYNILLGNIIHKDTTPYQQRFEEVKTMTVAKFKNEDGSFGEGTQSGYAFAIMLELDDPKVLCKKFVEKIRQDEYVFNAGIFGMAFTYEVLSQYGYDDVIEKWLLSNNEVSFKQMFSNGNKALAELFIGEHYSLNHAMFASYQQWYYQGLAGVKILEDAVAFDKIILSPYFSKQLNEVECSIETKQGTIRSSWIRKDGQIEWTLSIPKTVQYEIQLDKLYKQELIDGQIKIHMEG